MPVTFGCGWEGTRMPPEQWPGDGMGVWHRRGHWEGAEPQCRAKVVQQWPFDRDVVSRMSLYFWQKMSGPMNPGNSQVQVWICSVSVCQLCWRKNDCHTTVPSLSSYLATSPLHQQSSWLACYLLTLFFSSSLMPWLDQLLEFKKSQMYSWELMKNYWKNRWGLLESSIIHPSQPVSGQVAPLLASLQSFGPLLTLMLVQGHLATFGSWLCASAPWWVCSAAWSATKEGANLTCWHKCFCSVRALSLSPINTLGSTSFFDNILGSEEFQGLGKVRILFWCISHLEKCYKNMKSLLERVGNFISLFFFFSVTKDKYIQTAIVCGKWDGFNKFSRLQSCYNSSKPIFFFYLYFFLND